MAQNIHIILELNICTLTFHSKTVDIFHKIVLFWAIGAKIEPKVKCRFPTVVGGQLVLGESGDIVGT